MGWCVQGETPRINDFADDGCGEEEAMDGKAENGVAEADF